MKGPVKDYYEVLEIGRRAKPEVIKAAYVALMKLYHPDSGSKGDLEKAKLVNEAYKVLSDPLTRADYDRQGTKKDNVIGNYRLLEKIAEGGFGTTYKGEHIILGEPACIKHCNKLTPQDDAILLEEARAIWDLRHFAIPAVRDLVKTPDGSLALVQSFIPGKDLEKIVKKAGPLDEETVCWIAERGLNGLKYLHYHGVVHGDVKPQNLMIQPEEHTAVWVDFGLSAIKPTSKDAAKGYTRFFAPPEETAGRPLLPESDFYGLGMTMVYALVGGDLDLLKQGKIPVSVPDPLHNFIKRLVKKDVRDRPRWENEDLCETIATVRRESFGRARSNMKPIPGL